jgi:hypothetical protein
MASGPTRITTPEGAERFLVGRKIVAVELNRFDSGHKGSRRWTFDPVFVLDDGSRITFNVDETDYGCDYGISVSRWKKVGHP